MKNVMLLLVTLTSCVVASTPAKQPAPPPLTEVDPPAGEEPAAPPLASEPSGSSAPIQCGGNNEAEQQGIRISADTGAVVISGNCNYTLRDCEITAANQAVVVSGNGKLTLQRCQIRGKIAFVISGNAEVSVKDSVVFGRRNMSGNGELKDAGGNRFNAP